jgi:hypothetical protein
LSDRSTSLLLVREKSFLIAGPFVVALHLSQKKLERDWADVIMLERTIAQSNKETISIVNSRNIAEIDNSGPMN